MSSKKVTVTKILDDENTDSGFLSGPISEHIQSEELERDDSDKNFDSEFDTQLDSGLDLCITESLSNVKIDDTHCKQTPSVTILDEDFKKEDILPLDFLFQQDDDGDTQLHIAAVHGCSKTLGALIRVCPARPLLDIANSAGHTALHLAALAGHALACRMLVLAGAALTARDLTGGTPLHAAVATRQKECLHALLSPAPTGTVAAAVNQKNYDGQTCLHMAAAAGCVDLVQMLAYYGADLDAREGLAGWTALHIAACRGDSRVARLLVARGAAATPRDYAGRTPRRVGPRLAHMLPPASDTDSDTDDESYDSDSESLFEKLRDNLSAIDVA